ncbi:MAG: hypothetical protein H0V17_25890 [Deltaproteobacteria bacterium]|nr:hypothetical protein [Deltaproteobacteria bacterium]
MPSIGTVDLPDRLERERYFRELDYLELSMLYAGPLKPGVIAKWKAAPPKSIGLVAPWVLTDRVAPKAPRVWDHDATVGAFRDSAPGRAALAAYKSVLTDLDCACAVFRSPSVFAASAANRDLMTKFFGEVATAETLGVPIVWIPDGLWDPMTAITFARELGVTCAFDPMVREPGQSPEMFYDLDVESLYFRISGLGRAGAIRSERQEDLAMLIESYESVPVTVAFDSPQRWQDARNFRKLLAASSSSSSSVEVEEEEDDAEG